MNIFSESIKYLYVIYVYTYSIHHSHMYICFRITTCAICILIYQWIISHINEEKKIKIAQQDQGIESYGAVLLIKCGVTLVERSLINLLLWTKRLVTHVFVYYKLCFRMGQTNQTKRNPLKILGKKKIHRKSSSSSESFKICRRKSLKNPLR